MFFKVKHNVIMYIPLYIEKKKCKCAKRCCRTMEICCPCVSESVNWYRQDITNQNSMYFVMSIFIALIAGSFLTVITRLLQQPPHSWHHSATVGLAFGICFGILIIVHCSCIILSKPDCSHKGPVRKKIYQVLGFSAIAILLAVICLASGFFFNWALYHYPFPDDSRGDNGNEEAVKLFWLGIFGLLSITACFLIVTGILWFFLWLYSLGKQSYAQALAEDSMSVEELQEMMQYALPLDLVAICSTYVVMREIL
jgi:RsiW-degrading membrane proteinase PrsW (M82 family)